MDAPQQQHSPWSLYAKIASAADHRGESKKKTTAAAAEGSPRCDQGREAGRQKRPAIILYTARHADWHCGCNSALPISSSIATDDKLGEHLAYFHVRIPLARPSLPLPSSPRRRPPSATPTLPAMDFGEWTNRREKKSPRAQSMDGREGSQPVWPQICMFMYVPFHGPLRRHRPDPAVASPSYRIVPSHQSAAQVWFDCIFLIPLEALMLHFAVPTHRRQLAAAAPVLSVLFLLEHTQPRSPSRRRMRWREVEGGARGGGHAA